ncbi:MAG: DMT family transporter [Anaerolineales bacterium]|nr:DMT family transporter [Anaerolineales bacterium]
MISRRPPVPPLLVLTLGVMAVSTASIFIRYAQEDAPSLVIAAWRLTLATLLLAPLTVGIPGRRAELAQLTRRELGLGLLSGLFLAAHFATWISSLAYTTVASSVVFVDTAPLWVGLLAPLALGERISRPVKIGMALAVGGGIVVGVSDACVWGESRLICPPLSDFFGGQAFFGDLLALVGAITAATYLVIGRRVRERVSLITYIFVVYGAAALALIAMMLLAGQSAFGYPPIAYGWFLALAVFPQLLGHSSYNWALAYLPAAYVSLALLGEPIGSTLLAVIFLGEIPSLLKISGAALILAGIYVASTKGATDDIG